MHGIGVKLHRNNSIFRLSLIFLLSLVINRGNNHHLGLNSATTTKTQSDKVQNTAEQYKIWMSPPVSIPMAPRQQIIRTRPKSASCWNINYLFLRFIDLFFWLTYHIENNTNYLATSITGGAISVIIVLLITRRTYPGADLNKTIKGFMVADK